MPIQSPQTFIPVTDPALEVFEVSSQTSTSRAGNTYVTQVDQRQRNTYKVNNPGGDTNQVQFKSGDDFAGDSGFTYNAATDSLTLAGSLNVSGTYYGSGAGLNSIPGASVTGTVANTTYAASSGVAATVSGNAQANITSVGTLSSLAVTGNISAGNVTATTFTGSLSGTSTSANTAFAVAGANVSGEVTFAATANAVAGANVSGFVANATFATTAGTLTTAAQPNVTSTGTLTSLAVTGNATANNFVASFMVRTTPTTIELLGSAVTAGAGARAWVTNSTNTLVTANLLTVCANAGSGAASVPVFSDGTNWLIG